MTQHAVTQHAVTQHAVTQHAVTQHGVTQHGAVTRLRQFLRRDTGTVLPLTIFYALLSLSLVCVVVGATSLYLERGRLFALADGAALAGAESFSLDDVVVSRVTSGGTLGDTVTPRVTLQLRSEDVARAATSFLARIPRGNIDALTLERADSPDGRTARITLSAHWRPPMLTFFMPSGMRIEVTTHARSVFSLG